MTPYSEIYPLFLDRIIRDTTFFVRGVNEEELRRLTNARMGRLLENAIYLLVMSDGKTDFEVDFLSKETIDMGVDIPVEYSFTFELNLIEKNLLADLMFETYIKENFVSRIDAMRKIGFHDSEIKIQMNSPANALRELDKSYMGIQQDNARKVNNYKRRKRDTLQYKSFDFGYE